MTLIILIIATLAVLTSGYYLRQYTITKYQYNVAAIGSMVVSLIGAAIMALGALYLKQHINTQGFICLAAGLMPYVLMFIRDFKKTNLWVAIAAMMLRLAVSLIIVIILTILVLGGKRDPRELQKYTEHEFVK